MKVCVDAGHGGHDKGGKSLGAPEKDINLRCSRMLARELERLGHQVVTTRTTDVFVELSERARVANDAGAECFVSLHANASGDERVRGPWTIHARGSSRGASLARAVQRALALAANGTWEAVYPDQSGWTGDRRLAVLRQTRMPAVIVELGFMTNPTDSGLMADDRHLNMLADAVAQAVHAWALRGA